MKAKCDCGKLGTWQYMPGYYRQSNPYHCDECVPRGCSCQTEGVYDEEGILVDEYYLCDEEGRALPCIEFEYNKEGFEED